MIKYLTECSSVLVEPVWSPPLDKVKFFVYQNDKLARYLNIYTFQAHRANSNSVANAIIGSKFLQNGHTNSAGKMVLRFFFLSYKLLFFFKFLMISIISKNSHLSDWSVKDFICFFFFFFVGFIKLNKDDGWKRRKWKIVIKRIKFSTCSLYLMLGLNIICYNKKKKNSFGNTITKTMCIFRSGFLCVLATVNWR